MVVGDSRFADLRIRNIQPDETIPFLRKAIIKYSLTAKAYSNLRTLAYGIFEYAKEKGYFFRASQIRKRLYLSCRRLGIKKKSPHKLRKTYVSILLDNGVDKRLVQDVAGHAQISTSERNYHRNRKSDQKKEQILSNLPEFKNAKLMF